jgi:hypothetical protein
MVQVNGNYLKLKAGYLFPEIARRVKAFGEAHPEAAIIRLGIGDVTEPLPEACRAAMKAAVDEMGTREGFHGYGPEQGYAWLREAIASHDFQARGCQVSAEEIFVSDGSKCDSANILDILGEGNRIAVTDPVYPVYVDSNVMAGRTGEADGAGRYGGLTYLPISADNGFTAQIPSEKVDLIYLCFPNNPTGAVATNDQLKGWVERLLGEMQKQDIATKRANSKAELQSLLDAGFRGLIVSMIHKFEGIAKASCTRQNVYVFIDEAHRSVAKDLGTYLMAAVPNASILGFTGTPIANNAQGEGTFKIFGAQDDLGYLDKYSIKESIEDETTLPIKHVMAPSEMTVPAERLDKEFFELAEAEGISDVDELNKVLDRSVGLRTAASLGAHGGRRRLGRGIGLRERARRGCDE